VKALVLDSISAITTETGSQVVSELTNKGFDVEHIDLTKLDIRYCTGCFECWVKTPGICKFKDDAPEISRKVINADLVILISEIVYGGFSSTFKAMWDRNLGLLHPHFKKIKGEYHHKKRYKRYPALIILGLDTAHEEKWNDIFIRLLDRNMANWHAPIYRTVIIAENQPLDVGPIVDGMGISA
jgi:multimeric flavodoxin WrbA